MIKLLLVNKLCSAAQCATEYNCHNQPSRIAEEDVEILLEYDADWTVFADTVLADTSRHFRLERGFTGHEHYTELKIINMNGRLYDPVIARFFSPDNFVQAPGSTQGYNRYSYCLNNPLQWEDPSGERYAGAEPPRLLHEYIREDMWDGSYFSDYLSSGGMSYDRCGPNRRYELQFHQPHLFTSADGTRYEISYYMAAVGVGGVYKWLTEEESELLATITHSKDFGILWHSIITPYEEEWRIYSKMVEVRDPRYFGSGIINGLNGFAMANGVKTNLFEAAVRYNYSDFRRWHQFTFSKQVNRSLRYNEVLGGLGVKYLRGSEILGGAAAVSSAVLDITNYCRYTTNNGFDWAVTTKFGMDMIMTVAGFLGPVGLAVSTAYFVLDVATDSFGGFGKMY